VNWLEAPDYWLARLLLHRGLAVLYLVAFLSAVNQFRPLLGERGLLPVTRYLRSTRGIRGPSVFAVHYSDRFAMAVAWTGLVLAAVALAGVPEVVPLPVSVLWWLALWALYLSIVNVGQIWYSFGWESLLLEAGFFAAFLGPADMTPPTPAIFMLRWLLFRVEFGAGLIKMRGDPCWRDLTCLHYHHETQPLPNPLSWYFHRLPGTFHRIEVAANHVAQLVAPFGLFAPQPIASVAGGLIFVTQGYLVLSGNFSWLNAVTMVLAVSALDDSALDFLPVSSGELASVPAGHDLAVVAVAALVVALSWWPVMNMASRRQRMNFSFNRFHLVNTYGAFGSITRRRYEVIIEGTANAELDPDTVWQEYEFKGKPGDPRRRPRQVAPYHLRLDWLMWFAALSPSYAGEWFGPLVVKLLEGDQATLRLLAHNPFTENPPVFARARLYDYRFTTWRERRATGAWWVRTPAGEFLSPVRLSADHSLSRTLST